MTPDTKLREALKKHGFVSAADQIAIHARDVDAALASWRGYPASMDKYPLNLTGKPKL